MPSTIRGKSSTPGIGLRILSIAECDAGQGKYKKGTVINTIELVSSHLEFGNYWYDNS